MTGSITPPAAGDAEREASGRSPDGSAPAGADRLTAEMRIQFDADELHRFFEAFDPLENPFDAPPRQLPDRRPGCDTAQAA